MTTLHSVHILAKQIMRNNLWSLPRRCSFSTSVVVSGRKTRNPYDRRFGVHPKDVAPTKPGGTIELAQKFGRGVGMPQPPGIYTKEGKFVLVKEMIPEFVVPDLKDFRLQPYVSYRVPDVKQSEFTAKDLFDAVYAKPIVEDFKNGKLDINKINERIKAITLESVKE